MCNRKQLNLTFTDAAKRYNAQIAEPRIEIPLEQYAFDHPTTLTIRAESPTLIESNFRWGLVPADWNKPYTEIWNSTYNAKIEYLYKRYAYKNITNQRCLIPCTSYYEHHWNDLKGKSKTLFEIVHTDAEVFSLAGLYSIYTSPTGEVLNTYTVLTTAANERMQYVHNKDAQKDYHRMPLMLNPEDEFSWLDTKIPYMDFCYPNYHPRLIAEVVAGENLPPQQLGFDF
jgi:putative SOS response-associated peptidase YedK